MKKFILDKKIKNKLVIGYINEMNYKLEKGLIEFNHSMIEAVHLAIIIITGKAIIPHTKGDTIYFYYDNTEYEK